MRDLAQKFDNVGDTLSAAEFNSDQQELENAVTSSGQSLDPAGGPNTDLYMLGKAMSVYGSGGGDWYNDSGSANAYVLAKSGSLVSSDLFDGMTCRFIVSATNTGASTINVSGLGVKSIVDLNGDALARYALIAGEQAEVVYDLSNDYFLLTRQATPLNTYNSQAGYVGGFKALNLNGSFNVWQGGTSFTGINSGFVIGPDGTKLTCLGATTATYSMSRSTTVPSGSSGYSLLATVTTQQASVAAADSRAFNAPIEGFDWASAVANGYVTISFYVRSSLTGQYGVSLVNTGNDRSIVNTITINAANTWELKTVTFRLNYSGGTWDYATGLGAALRVVLMSGSNYQTGTTDTWLTGNYQTTSSQANHAGTNGNTFYLHRLQVERGRAFTGFNFIDASANQARCQRYRIVLSGPSALPFTMPVAQGHKYDNTTAHVVFNLPGGMRPGTPSITALTGWTPVVYGEGLTATVTSFTVPSGALQEGQNFLPVEAAANMTSFSNNQILALRVNSHTEAVLIDNSL